MVQYKSRLLTFFTNQYNSMFFRFPTRVAIMGMRIRRGETGRASWTSCSPLSASLWASAMFGDSHISHILKAEVRFTVYLLTRLQLKHTHGLTCISKNICEDFDNKTRL